jgi:outer membrane protein OmpA-like peptidoglycan-associated protein
MLLQNILKATFAIFVTFGLASPVIAQLKPSDNSNQVLVDLSVINSLVNKSQFGHTFRSKSKQGNLLKPPTVMPRSRYLIEPSTTKTSNKLARIKLNPAFKSLKKRYKRGKISNKLKLQLSKERMLKQPRPKTKTLKLRSRKKLLSAPKQNLNRPIRLSKTNLTEPVINKKISAPAPKAVPLAPVKILKMPPPIPKYNAIATKPKTKLIPQQMASRPRKNIQKSTANLLIFKQGEAKLSNQAKKTLDALSKKLKVKPKHKLQIQAYAGEPNLSASNARRLSLSRALAVRSHLIKNGIRSTRIDVRALGNKTSVGEPNRVDLKFVKN